MTYNSTSTNISLAISAYDIMKAKKNSKDGVKHFTETSENPMQTQSKNIETCIDEKNNLAYTKDDGKGFLDLKKLEFLSMASVDVSLLLYQINE